MAARSQRTRGFVDIAIEEFSFLELTYNFKLTTRKTESWGGYVRFKNVERGVGVHISYEYRDAFVFMMIFRLIDGEFVETREPLRKNTRINHFDFHDLLEPAQRMKRGYEYPESSSYFHERDGLKNFVADFASRLKRYGKDVLRGDFTRLPIAEKAIRARAREYPD